MTIVLVPTIAKLEAERLDNYDALLTAAELLRNSPETFPEWNTGASSDISSVELTETGQLLFRFKHEVEDRYYGTIDTIETVEFNIDSGWVLVTSENGLHTLCPFAFLKNTRKLPAELLGQFHVISE